jgi:hypothetical protein
VDGSCSNSTLFFNGRHVGSCMKERVSFVLLRYHFLSSLLGVAIAFITALLDRVRTLGIDWINTIMLTLTVICVVRPLTRSFRIHPE